MTMRRAASVLLSVSLLTVPLLAAAARFPDVPGDHPYNSPVEALVIEGVLTGNPDGNFYPARPVNRAEFLTMLYRATEKTPSAVSVSCFSDVKAAAWYANVVCDAVAQGYVGGYPDGSFKPEQSVNRVEALKMIYKVFGFAILTGIEADESAKTFVDVGAGQWYMGYLSSSYRNGLLPIAGYTGNKFYPTNALLRGEAAAYIWRAMNITGDVYVTTESSSSSSPSSSSVARSSRSSSASADDDVRTMQVDFPFSDGGDVGSVKNFVYTFPINASSDIDIEVKIGSGSDPDVSCRLYLLGENNLSQEYYLGYVQDGTCRIKASVPKGSYQLEVRPGVEGGTYAVVTRNTKGDGNDGFDEAKTLVAGKPAVGQLAVSDIADWYTFTIELVGTHTVNVFGDDVGCYIYPLKDVDLFGFTTPVCGEAYEYQKGTYVVRIQRDDGVDKALTYTVQRD